MMSSERTVLFSIPIYALKRKELKSKVVKVINRIEQENDGLDKDIKSLLIDHCTFPFRSWKYNHIIGYIEISAWRNDVYFNLYMPYKQGRYIWNTTRKTLIHNVMSDYPHFFVLDTESGDQIFETIRLWLREVEEHIPKRYYIDYESFDLLSKYLDIKALLQEIRNCQ